MALDEAFLIELDGYREMLARAFKSKNPDLNGEQLTEITQRTIDRLVFIRFLEDKQIEATRHVERFGENESSAWEDFVRVSLHLDRIYNGVVFTRHPILDAPGFQIEEKSFRIICEELSNPHSPYNFDAIPIFGSIYERSLGKIITDGARIVEKPEVRKAGGVLLHARIHRPLHRRQHRQQSHRRKNARGNRRNEICRYRLRQRLLPAGNF